MATSTSGTLQPSTALAGSYVISALGSILAGDASARVYEARAALARVNANIARAQGVAAADAQHRDAERALGSIKASYGASGVQSDNGSPLDVLADSAATAALDNLKIKYNYELKALGYETESSMDMMSAENSRTSGILNAAASGLGAYAIYSGYKSPPGTPIPGVGAVNNSAVATMLGSGNVQT